MDDTQPIVADVTWPTDCLPIASRKNVLELRFVASNKKVLEMVCEK
jgi:hypothetical protein